MNILDVIFPRWCVGCNRRLTNSERYLCLHCLAEMPRTGLWTEAEDNKLMQKYYGFEVTERDKKPLLLDRKTPFVDRAAAYVPYISEGLTGTIVKTFKYCGNKHLARYCGMLMAQEICAAETPTSQNIFKGIDVIVPVPMTFRRRLWRGYNQTEWMVRGIADETHIPVRKDLLRRRYFKTSQTKIHDIERARNVENAFYLNDIDTTPFHGKHLLLVDDIITTGATTKACCTALADIPNVTVSILSFATARYK